MLLEIGSFRKRIYISSRQRGGYYQANRSFAEGENLLFINPREFKVKLLLGVRIRGGPFAYPRSIAASANAELYDPGYRLRRKSLAYRQRYVDTGGRDLRSSRAKVGDGLNARTFPCYTRYYPRKSKRTEIFVLKKKPQIYNQCGAGD